MNTFFKQIAFSITIAPLIISTNIHGMLIKNAKNVKQLPQKTLCSSIINKQKPLKISEKEVIKEDSVKEKKRMAWEELSYMHKDIRLDRSHSHPDPKWTMHPDEVRKFVHAMVALIPEDQDGRGTE